MSPDGRAGFPSGCFKAETSLRAPEAVEFGAEEHLGMHQQAVDHVTAACTLAANPEPCRRELESLKQR